MNSPFCGVCYEPIPADHINNPLETVTHNGMYFHKKCCVCCCCHKPTTEPNFLFCGIYCPECFRKLFSTPGFKMANLFCYNLWNGSHCGNCMSQFLQNFMKSTMNGCTPNISFPTPGMNNCTSNFGFQTFKNASPNATGQSSNANCQRPCPPPPGASFCPNPGSNFMGFTNVNPMSQNSQPSGPQNCYPQMYFSSEWVNTPYFNWSNGCSGSSK